jgi:ATP-dependent Zn protease
MNVEATAYHEAGHAVMTAACNRKIYSATIIPRDDAHGSVEHENPLRGIKLKFNNG